MLFRSVSDLISPALAVGGGAEARKELVSLMEADQMECEDFCEVQSQET